MNKTFLGMLLSTALLAGTAVYAQSSQSEQRYQSAPAAAQEARETEPITGKVKTYTPGKRLEIDVAVGMDKEYDLTDKNVTANVNPNVKVGTEVKVWEKTADGRKMITVEPVAADASEKGKEKQKTY
jgi:hypothetical protein